MWRRCRNDLAPSAVASDSRNHRACNPPCEGPGSAMDGMRSLASREPRGAPPRRSLRQPQPGGASLALQQPGGEPGVRFVGFVDGDLSGLRFAGHFSGSGSSGSF